jgi:RNA polymerase sigma-B factor
VTPTEERRRELLAAYAADRDTVDRDEIVREYLPLVRALARRYAGRNEQLEDLVQVGCIGLVKALDRYDPERGRFSTYAVPTIVGEIKRHFRDRTWTIAVPRPIKDLSLSVSKQLDALSSELGRSPTVSELAQAVDAEEEDVLEAMLASRAQSADSLSALSSDEADPDLIAALGHNDAGFRTVEDRALLARGIQALEPRERRIVELRFFDELSQAQIAERIGISQMHVSRLLRASLEKMRTSIGEAEPE